MPIICGTKVYRAPVLCGNYRSKYFLLWGVQQLNYTQDSSFLKRPTLGGIWTHGILFCSLGEHSTSLATMANQQIGVQI